ncbi:MAG: hypothetical protein PHD25_09390 [Bacteroidales bacterium]|nr:hypothetical protein [Bacteroidales bacterium]
MKKTIIALMICGIALLKVNSQVIPEIDTRILDDFIRSITTVMTRCRSL